MLAMHPGLIRIRTRSEQQAGASMKPVLVFGQTRQRGVRQRDQRRHIEHVLAAGAAPVLRQAVDAAGIGGDGAANCRFISAGASKKQVALPQFGTFGKFPRRKGRRGRSSWWPYTSCSHSGTASSRACENLLDQST